MSKHGGTKVVLISYLYILTSCFVRWLDPVFGTLFAFLIFSNTYSMSTGMYVIISFWLSQSVNSEGNGAGTGTH